ncbi:PTS mannose/fructose/sorbose family IIA subunit [Streptococcus penaeicida]|uniref:PTS mannose/fructose/sorbose family IIA subunit n=1 Tax=Streptococcus penaeicida TaxID=1765960 RepID=A0A2N8LAV4_9STRE|nr:PTS sugar transporter subunit IIA [Streptococcus penaeicida]PND47293.1 PTS mannose/fructose/sorbose family IIA subunit [Streptococcus penaeicida]
MNQVILIAHGDLAVEMKKSAEMLFGKLDNFHPISFLAEEGLDSLQEKISGIMEALNSPVLVFTDIFCGTPYNASCSVALKNPQFDMSIISGMSLPLVLELAILINSKSISEVSEELQKAVVDTVRIFNKDIIDDEEEL